MGEDAITIEAKTCTARDTKYLSLAQEWNGIILGQALEGVGMRRGGTVWA
jgi:hypothetical protein